MRGTATFDRDGLYRYELTRTWDETLPSVTWIMLNPSTADAHTDDPTISRVVGFSRNWGYGSAHVVNLFALRATSPSELRRATNPVGPDNDLVLTEVFGHDTPVIAAWGNQGAIRNPTTDEPRCQEVWRLLDDRSTEVWCLGLTRRGQPTHPLYLPGDSRPMSVDRQYTGIHGRARLASELSG